MSLVAELKSKNSTDQIALRGVRIVGRVVGLHQHMTIEQTYVNMEDEPIEASYTFPLPAEAAVCEFEARTDDRVLIGGIDEIDKNAELYESAIERGDGAFLVEQHRPDIFAAWVGNIKPGQAVTIRISYIAPVEIYERIMRIALPTTVSPRYVTASGGRDPLETMVDDIAVNPPHVLHVPYGLSIELYVAPPSPIRRLQSPSHAIEVADDDGAKTASVVTLTGGTTEMDRDVVLNVELEQADSPSGLCCRDEDGHTYAMVNFIPEFDDLLESGPAETVFMIDTSSSMSGSSFEEAKRALTLCLRSLNTEDKFNIVEFNSNYRAMSARPLRYDAQSLEKALHWVGQLQAQGGTELFAPLQSVLPNRPAVGKVRQLIVLTDGQVSNEEELIELAQKHREHNRIFTFAIGHGASRHLTGSLAKSTGGVCEFIAPGERIEEKVLRTFARLGTPLVSDICVHWGERVKHFEQAPVEIMSVFDGDPLTVFARMEGVPDQVTLSCRHGERPYSWSVDLHETTASETLSRFWARQRIRDLASAPVSSQDRRRLKRVSTRERMIDLSCRFEVLCEHTSFLAIETRSDDERTDGQPAQRRIPIQLTAGWGGIETRSARGRGDSEGFFEMDTSFGFSPAYGTSFGDSDFESYGDVFDANLEVAGVESSATESEALFQITKLLDFQQAEGNFRYGEGSLDLLSDGLSLYRIDLMQLRTRLKKMTERLGLSLDQEVLDTLLVLALLENLFAEQRLLWKRATAKAERWLNTKLDRKDRQRISLADAFA